MRTWCFAISAEEDDDLCYDTRILMRDREAEADPQPALELCIRHGISGYDAQFVALATNQRISLVTEDQQLMRKFPALALSVANYCRPRSDG